MKHILKSITLLLCLCMVLSLVACGDNQPAGESSTPSTQGTVSDTQTVEDGPNENQCAGDISATTEETDYPTEETVIETTEEEAPVEEETTESVPEDDIGADPLPEEEEDPGDIQLPLDEIVE